MKFLRRIQGKQLYVPTQHNTTRHVTTRHDTAQHETTQHNTTRHDTAQHNTTQHITTSSSSTKWCSNVTERTDDTSRTVTAETSRPIERPPTCQSYALYCAVLLITSFARLWFSPRQSAWNKCENPQSLERTKLATVDTAGLLLLLLQ